MNKDKALKLAEEALDELRYANDTDIAKTKYYKALAAIREAKAELEKQEPVAWVDAKEEGYEFYGISYLPVGKHHLYAAPVDAKAIRAEALEEAIKIVDNVLGRQNAVSAAIRGLK